MRHVPAATTLIRPTRRMVLVVPPDQATTAAHERPITLGAPLRRQLHPHHARTVRAAADTEPIPALARLTDMDPIADLLHDYYIATLGEGVRNDDGDTRIMAAIRAASEPVRRTAPEVP